MHPGGAVRYYSVVSALPQVDALAEPLDLACVHCDLPLRLDPLAEGERAACPRCGFLVSARIRNGLSRSMALAVASLILLAFANSFPFLSLHAKGLESVMTLPHSAVVMYEDGYVVLACIVLAVIVVIPAVMMLTIMALTIPLSRGQNAAWLVPGGRLLFLLSPWSMVEVFIIGVIVSLVKITHMAHVVLGLAFWAYVAFTISFTAAMASLDRLEIWRRIERCRA